MVMVGGAHGSLLVCGIVRFTFYVMWLFSH